MEIGRGAAISARRPPPTPLVGSMDMLWGRVKVLDRRRRSCDVLTRWRCSSPARGRSWAAAVLVWHPQPATAGEPGCAARGLPPGRVPLCSGAHDRSHLWYRWRRSSPRISAGRSTSRPSRRSSKFAEELRQGELRHHPGPPVLLRRGAGQASLCAAGTARRAADRDGHRARGRPARDPGRPERQDDRPAAARSRRSASWSRHP